MCIGCFHNINENKPPLYQVLNKKIINKKIQLVKKLTQLKEWLISPCFTFAQIYKLQKYMQHKMYGNVIVPTNVNQIQSMLPRSPHDGATICVFLKRHLKYESFKKFKS
jgi:hypothetical protein